MAKVEFKSKLPLLKEDDRINQGDYIYCKGLGGANSFWGIYNSFTGTVTSLDGAGSSYIAEKYLYLNETYTYWTIIKRIPCDKVKITIEEID